MEISASGPLLNCSRDFKNYAEIMYFFMKQGTTLPDYCNYSLQIILQFTFYSPPWCELFCLLSKYLQCYMPHRQVCHNLAKLL
jgi:hypothetical protein